MSGTPLWLQFINVENKGAGSKSDPCSLVLRRRKLLGLAKLSSLVGSQPFPASPYPRKRPVQCESGSRSGNGSGGQACNMKWGEGSTENVEKGLHVTTLMSPPTYQ